MTFSESGCPSIVIIGILLPLLEPNRLLELHLLRVPHLAVVVVGGADRGGVLLEDAFGGATFAASDLYVGADGGTRFDDAGGAGVDAPAVGGRP